MEEDFIDPDEAARILRSTRRQLAQMRYMGTGPRFYKPSPKRVLYKRSEIIAFIEAGAQQRTGEASLAS